MSTETSPTYEIISDAKSTYYAFAIVSITVGTLGFWGTHWVVFLLPLLIGGGLIFLGRRIVNDHAKIEHGIIIRFSGERIINEFDLRSIEEWSLKIFSDRDNGGFAGASLFLKSNLSNNQIEISYHGSRLLFIEVLTILHRDKRNLVHTNPALLEPEFPLREPELRQLVKNW